MKLHACTKGGFVHSFTETWMRAWDAVPVAMRERLVRAHTAIEDVAERDNWYVADLRHDLARELELAADAIGAHPSAALVPGNGRWFRLMALAESQGRADRCPMCFRYRAEQMELLPAPAPPAPPQRPPAPPQRPPAPVPLSAGRSTSTTTVARTTVCVLPKK